MADQKSEKENAALKQQIFFLTNLINSAKHKEVGQFHNDNQHSRASRKTYSYNKKHTVPKQANIKIDSHYTKTVTMPTNVISLESNEANVVRSVKNIQMPMMKKSSTVHIAQKVLLPVQIHKKHESNISMSKPTPTSSNQSKPTPTSSNLSKPTPTSSNLPQPITTSKPTPTSSILNKTLKKLTSSKTPLTLSKTPLTVSKTSLTLSKTPLTLSKTPLTSKTSTSLDLDKHSLASLKKMLASKLEAKESRKTIAEKITKSETISKLASQKNETGSTKSSMSTLPDNASGSLPISTDKTLNPIPKLMPKNLPKKQDIQVCSTSKEKSCVSSSKPPHLKAVKSDPRPVKAVQDVSTLPLPTKGDLAKNLKNTEAKIKELTVELTKLKEVAKIVSASPEKAPLKTTRKPSVHRSLHHYHKQSSSTDISSTPVLNPSKRKHSQSNTQSAAKYVISKYRLKKMPVKKHPLSGTIENPKFSKRGLPTFDTKYKTSKKSTTSVIFDPKYKTCKKSYMGRPPMPGYNKGVRKKRTYNISSRWTKPAFSSYIYSSPYKYGGRLNAGAAVKKQHSMYTFKKQTKWSPHSRYRLNSRNKHVFIKGGNFSQEKLTEKDKSMTITVRGVKFQIGRKGKTLQRFDSKTNTGVLKPRDHPHRISRINYRGVTYVETKPGMLEKVSTSQARWRASQSVQKSIVLSRHKDKKTQRQYCIFYCRFGKCNRGDKCTYIHDPDKVAVCTRFLRGTCKIENCPFSHKVSKDKMPVCSYFLRGLCVRENCPYLHVKVGENAKVCRDFVKGYCPRGEKCKEKHIRVCHEFVQTGQCAAGKKCPLEHRTKTLKRPSTKPSLPQNNRFFQNPEVVTPSARTSQQREGLDVEDSHTIPFKIRKLPAFMEKLPAFISIGSLEDAGPLKSTKSSPVKQSPEPLRIKPRLC